MGAVSVVASCCVNVKLVMVEGGRRMTYSSCPIEKNMRMETMTHGLVVEYIDGMP